MGAVLGSGENGVILGCCSARAADFGGGQGFVWGEDLGVLSMGQRLGGCRLWGGDFGVLFCIWDRESMGQKFGWGVVYRMRVWGGLVYGAEI